LKGFTHVSSIRHQRRNQGDLIEIGVDASNYVTGDYIEISGHATQTGGAFANFYDIKEVDDPSTSVYVQAHPLPPNQFKKSEDVTIVVRVGKVWLTVLGRPYDKTQEGEAAEDGTRWDQLRKWSEVNRSSDAKDGYPPPAGSSSFPTNGSSSAHGSSSPTGSSPPV